MFRRGLVFTTAIAVVLLVAILGRLYSKEKLSTDLTQRDFKPPGTSLVERIKFLGNLDHKEVLSYMRVFLASICPSRTEGGGIVNLEAQACGTLSIGSDAGGIPEYIHDGITGFIYHKTDISELSKLLVFANENSQKKREPIHNAINNVKEFSGDRFSKEHLKIYHQAFVNAAEKRFRTWSDLSTKM